MAAGLILISLSLKAGEMPEAVLLFPPGIPVAGTDLPGNGFFFLHS
jgi:hypothetical protein